MSQGSCIRVDDFSVIKDIIDTKSQSVSNYLLKSKLSKFVLYSKTIKHSDLISSGKRTKESQPFEKNILYYLTAQEMRIIETHSQKKFETAHQTNIGLPREFYTDLQVDNPRDNRVFNEKKFVDLRTCGVQFYVVNDTVEYFSKKYTSLVVSKLSKDLNYEISDIKLDESGFTPIQVSQAVHGLGCSQDLEFQNLRKNIFVNDTIHFLIEKTNANVKIFIILEKNPKFYEISGLANKVWARHLEIIQRQQTAAAIASKSQGIEDEKTRKLQSAWKNQLAREMMNYTTYEGRVFCPLTHIGAIFEDVPMLFIASHIKSYKDSNEQEVFDINNGLLLCANADALFDKHMITVSEDKKLVFSFLIDRDAELKQNLLLNQPIFQLILNEKRMEYLKEHRRIFYEKEKERKLPNHKEYELEQIDYGMVAEPKFA